MGVSCARVNLADLSFLSCFLSFFSLFFLSLSSFIFLLSFYALFLSSFLFFFLSFFLALLVFFFLSFLSRYTERAPTRTRVCWDSTHTGELLKMLFDVLFSGAAARENDPDAIPAAGFCHSVQKHVLTLLPG